MDSDMANLTAHILLANLKRTVKWLNSILSDSQLDFDHPINGKLRHQIRQVEDVIKDCEGRMS